MASSSDAMELEFLSAAGEHLASFSVDSGTTGKEIKMELTSYLSGETPARLLTGDGCTLRDEMVVGEVLGCHHGVLHVIFTGSMLVKWRCDCDAAACHDDGYRLVRQRSGVVPAEVPLPTTGATIWRLRLEDTNNNCIYVGVVGEDFTDFFINPYMEKGVWAWGLHGKVSAETQSKAEEPIQYNAGDVLRCCYDADARTLSVQLEGAEAAPNPVFDDLPAGVVMFPFIGFPSNVARHGEDGVTAISSV